MALKTKSISAVGANNHHKFTLTVNENKTSVENNTSSISFNFNIAPSQGGYWNWLGWGQQISYSININGKAYSGYIPDYDGTSNVTLKTDSLTIEHTTDGTKEINISFSVTDKTGQTYTCGNASTSGKMALTDIARASSVSGGSGNIGAETTITIKRALDDFTHKLEYQFGSLKGTIATGVGTSCKWVIPTSFYNQIPDDNVGEGTITCTTYNGDVLVGTTTANFNAYVVNSDPIFKADNVTYKDSDEDIVAITENDQYIVQDKSNLRVTYTSATAQNGASIVKYRFEINGMVRESTNQQGIVEFGTINSASDTTLTITAIDTRGNSTKVKKTIPMIEYKFPTAIVDLKRVNNYEDETHLKVDCTYSSVKGKNKINIWYRYKKIDGAWGDYALINDNETLILSLDKNFAFEVNVYISDSFSTVWTKNFSLGKGIFPFFINTVKSSVGVNGFPKKEKSFEVTGEFLVNDKTIFDLIYPIGSIYMSVNSTNPSTIFGGTWEQLKDTFLLAAGDTYTAGATGGEAEHTLTVDEIPPHTHQNKNSVRVVSGTTYYVPGLTTSGYDTVTTGSTGGGKAHNNMPPYLVVYMWKRTG